MCVPEDGNNAEKEKLLFSFRPDIFQATLFHLSFPHAESKGEQPLQTLMIRLHAIFNLSQTYEHELMKHYKCFVLYLQKANICKALQYEILL